MIDTHYKLTINSQFRSIKIYFHNYFKYFKYFEFTCILNNKLFSGKENMLI